MLLRITDSGTGVGVANSPPPLIATEPLGVVEAVTKRTHGKANVEHGISKFLTIIGADLGFGCLKKESTRLGT
jgi:hypothetical protein